MKRNSRNWIGISAAVAVVVLGLLWLSTSQAPIPPGGLLPRNNGTSVIPTATPAKAKATTSTSPSSSTVVGIAKGISSASTFASWLVSTGVAGELAGKGPYTIFIPTNTAMGNQSSAVSNLSTAEKKRLVEYHVIVGRALDVNAVVSGSVTALSKDLLNFTNVNKVPRVNSSSLNAHYVGTNGVVYVIDSVLLPPKKSF